MNSERTANTKVLLRHKTYLGLIPAGLGLSIFWIACEGIKYEQDKAALMALDGLHAGQRQTTPMQSRHWTMNGSYIERGTGFPALKKSEQSSETLRSRKNHQQDDDNSDSLFHPSFHPSTPQLNCLRTDQKYYRQYQRPSTPSDSEFRQPSV
jgi:hypothetical protein